MADISITITGRAPAGKSVALILRPELNNLERALERAGIRDVKVATNLQEPAGTEPVTGGDYGEEDEPE